MVGRNFCVLVASREMVRLIKVSIFWRLKVNWYPWGEEAFAEATKRDVPIFLSSNMKFIFALFVVCGSDSLITSCVASLHTIFWASLVGIVLFFHSKSATARATGETYSDLNALVLYARSWADGF